MTRKLSTINLSGNEYAKVPTRLKAFREECPNGNIDTTQEFLPNGLVKFKTTVTKDMSNPASAKATGTALGRVMTGERLDNKAFEKHETISVGRALANLGYLISGEVASSEEMEDFLSDKELKKADRIAKIKEEVDALETYEDVREFYRANKGFGAESDAYIVARGVALGKAEKGGGESGRA